VHRILALSAVVWLIAAPAWGQHRRAAAPVAAPVAGTSLGAEALLLLDPDGRVLFARNAAEDHAPASLVKLMTLYLAYEDLEAGRAQGEEPVVISPHAAATPRYRMGLRVGDTPPLRTPVAEHLSGTEDQFVARMNSTAQVLGLTATRFANPHGLPDPNQRTTAQDMAMLTSRLVEDYPASRTILGGKTFIYRGRVYARRIPLFEDPGGVQALKTGFTNEAGYNLAIAAWRAGHRYLLIVMGAQTRSQSFRDARRLLRFGFNEAALDAAEQPRREEPRKPPPRRLPPRRSSANVRGR
jgi:D-alanyl-D-alanine carboxypeptidase